MKRLLSFGKRSLWLLLYITPVVLGTYYFGGKLLRQKLIEALNEQLQVRVEVSRVQFNGFQSFPKLGISFYNVQINESSPHFKQPLLSAGEISLVFNPLKLIQGNNEIDRINVENGVTRIFIGQNGSNNFEIFKPDTTSNKDSPLELNLKKVLLQNFRCIYLDEGTSSSFNFYANKLLFAGRFGEEKYDLNTKGDALFDHMMFDGQRYISGKKVDVDIAIKIDTKLQAYQINKAMMVIDELEIQLNGDVLMVNSIPDIDIGFEGNNMDIQSLLSLMPNAQNYALRDLESKGVIALKGNIKGRLEEGKLPKIQTTFALKDVSIFLPDQNFDLRNVQLSGTFSNRNPDNFLSLDIDLKGLKMPNTNLSGHFAIQDLLHPKLVYKSQGSVDLRDLEGFAKAKEPAITSFYGLVNFNMAGTLAFDDAKDIDLAASNANGDLEVKDLTFNHTSAGGIEHLYAAARIQGNHLKNVEVKGYLFNNQILFKGSVSNWQTYLLNQNRLMVKGELASQDLNLNRLLNTEDETAEGATTTEVDINLGVDIDLTISAAKFQWNNLKTSELNGQLLWEGSDININNLRFKAWNGVVNGTAALYPDMRGFVLLAHAKANEVSIEALFKDFDNFGQTEFTPDIIKGTLTTDFDIRLMFDKAFNLIEDSILTNADISIVNGRLKNYEPMKSLSKFVQLTDLMDIRFEEIKNTLEIKNRTLFIPSMKIVNNALNVELGGSHTFDNYMDYKIKIGITDLLAGKSGWAQKKQEKQLQNDKGGGLSAYLHMTGTPEDLKIRYDVKSVKAVVGEEIKAERTRFIQDFKKELKGQSIESTEPKKDRWIE